MCLWCKIQSQSCPGNKEKLDWKEDLEKNLILILVLHYKSCTSSILVIAQPLWCYTWEKLKACCLTIQYILCYEFNTKKKVKYWELRELCNPHLVRVGGANLRHVCCVQVEKGHTGQSLLPVISPMSFLLLDNAVLPLRLPFLPAPLASPGVRLPPLLLC